MLNCLSETRGSDELNPALTVILRFRSHSLFSISVGRLLIAE